MTHGTGAEPHAPRPSPAASLRRRLVAAGLLALIAALALTLIEDRRLALAAIVCGGALVSWLSEAVPPHVTTLALIAVIPLALGGRGGVALGEVMGWAADPVLALFFGGLALGAAATRHGLDGRLAERALALSRHRRRSLLALVMAATAVLSMWISNVAAAALGSARRWWRWRSPRCCSAAAGWSAPTSDGSTGPRCC